MLAYFMDSFLKEESVYNRGERKMQLEVIVLFSFKWPFGNGSRDLLNMSVKKKRNQRKNNKKLNI